MIAGLLALLVGSVGAFVFSSIQDNAPPTASLTILEGEVLLLKARTTDWIKVEERVLVSVGDRIKTSDNSRALLTFSEGTSAELGSNTDLGLQNLVRGPEGRPFMVELKLWLGTTWNRVERLLDPTSRYQIETPSAVASVRGTEFVVKVDERQVTEVLGFQDEVEVTAQGVTVVVGPGQRAIVLPGQPPLQINPSAPVPSDQLRADTFPPFANRPLPTATPTPAPTPTLTPYVVVVLATNTPTPTPTATTTVSPTPNLYCDSLRILEPADGAVLDYGFTIRWAWKGTLGPNQNFEVRLWREGQPAWGIAAPRQPFLEVAPYTLEAIERYSLQIAVAQVEETKVIYLCESPILRFDYSGPLGKEEPEPGPPGPPPPEETATPTPYRSY
ncbi:MAG: FecR domain-containing protein [Anaerolineae bacterium]